MESGPAKIYGGGAGGKFRKPPARKRASTPYDRPKANQSTNEQPRGWLSKLVSPSYDLISRGATKLIPAFFSNSVANTSDHGNDETELAANPEIDEFHSPDPEIYRSGNEAGPSKRADSLETNTWCPELEGGKRGKSSEDSELYKIEQIIKGKMFSRDEIHRLTDILNSNVASDVERETNQPSLTAEGEAKMKVSFAPEHHMITTEIERDVNRNVLRVSSPRIESNIQNNVNASPIDIAKAYMRSHTSELVPSAYSTMSKTERALYRGDDIQANPSNPQETQLSSRPSTCGPGPVVQDQHGYATPLGQRGSFGLQKFSRTPYSRTVYSNSQSRFKPTQLQQDKRPFNISPSPIQQSRTPIFAHSRTPIFGKVKSRTDDDSGYGTGGAIRRTRSKFASETPGRGSASLYSLQNGSSLVKESNTSKVFFPKEKNMELIGTSGTVNNQPVESVEYGSNGSKEGLPTSSPQSSPVARDILEHLANKPTPNELATESKFVSAWKYSPSKNNDVFQSEFTSSTQIRGSVDLQKNATFLKFSAKGSNDGEYLTNREKSEESDALNAITMKSKVNGYSNVPVHTSVEPLFGIKKGSEFQIKSTHENVFMDAKRQDRDTNSWPFHKQVNGQDFLPQTVHAEGSKLLEKQPYNFSGGKRTLKSISVDKKGGLGFTFPVSAPGILSEPPTPSIFPSFTSGDMSQAAEDSVLPSYTFGTKRSSPRHDFSSFPSTSNSSTDDMASDIKFSFGSSQRNNRVSFKLVGKDPVSHSLLI
ncbi:hypothetical protein POM88_009903 [Heracleum sosnowskyi]|uniref:Uncharacterized protein n=1 Tax=Heracleum sosnowskyi TaxID=360622 RepID=A0AAD8J8U1_9APIA|nr:hypothetical protein POM88_009903 [Heracleum sosnowskyi]